MKYVSYALLIAVSFLAGCSMYFRWNSVLHGAEFENDLLFNLHGIGVRLDGLYVLNASTVGNLKISFRNFSRDTFRIHTKDFVLRAGDDSLVVNPASAVEVVLGPDATADLRIEYTMYSLDHFELFTGRFFYLPDDFEIDLAPVPFAVGDSTYVFSGISFRPDRRGKEADRVKFND